MGLSYTGKSCLLCDKVIGCSRVPAPPAKMIPFRCVVKVSPRWLIERDYRVFGTEFLWEIRLFAAFSLKVCDEITSHIDRSSHPIGLPHIRNYLSRVDRLDISRRRNAMQENRVDIFDLLDLGMEMYERLM